MSQEILNIKDYLALLIKTVRRNSVVHRSQEKPSKNVYFGGRNFGHHTFWTWIKEYRVIKDEGIIRSGTRLKERGEN